MTPEAGAELFTNCIVLISTFYVYGLGMGLGIRLFKEAVNI